VFYSGSLLKYSFSEAKQNKSLSIVDMQEDGSFDIRYRSLAPKFDMREISGVMEELLDPAFYQSQKRDDYLKITLNDEGALIDPINRLRQIYPNVLHLERKWDLTDLRRKNSFTSVKDERKSELDLFETFYQEMTDRDFDSQKQDLMVSVIEAVKKEEALK
jgi:exonuclease SbcD